MNEANKLMVRKFSELSIGDVSSVGGKNASLGEMVRTLGSQGIAVPDGIATTAAAYWLFIEHNRLRASLAVLLGELKQDLSNLHDVAERIRVRILAAQFPVVLEDSIITAYRALSLQYGEEETDVAVRSSATAEDLPDASFAGQQETFLNVRGTREVLDACRRCYASLFTDRAIAYRINKNFDHLKIALSAGIQKMVRADLGSSGVMFSLDTETGFRDVVVINAAWGLGENVVQGTVTPDQYTVFKPLLADSKLTPIVEKRLGTKAIKMVYAGGTRRVTNLDTTEIERRAWVLSDEDVLTLSRWACSIEKHYGRPMDMEWAKDGRSGKLYIVQARPETVQTRVAQAGFTTYKLLKKSRVLATGASIGESIVTGKVFTVRSALELESVPPGTILVTEMTDPDWVPVMKRVKGIITDFGGRTCHAAIVSRELGIPAIVGTGNGTHVLKTGQEITLSTAEGDRGLVYEGELPFETHQVDLSQVPQTSTRIMLNLASPEEAFRWWRLPVTGIGLARMEFIINNHIGIHPLALLYPERVIEETVRVKIYERTRGYDSPPAFFVDKLAQGIARLASAQYPHSVIVRMSDFKTNEYANLLGGAYFEPQEENPMLGFRGASRYYSARYREGFALECAAIVRVRNEMGFKNVKIMIPFCRTLSEADLVLKELAVNGLERGRDGLEVYVMCEIPSNVILAIDFAERFDGFSIGSNDLTQLVLGVDRDSADLAYIFDERNEAVKRSICEVIERAHLAGRPVGICGQAPSDYPEFAAFLVEAGIDSISLNPDSVIQTKHTVANAEAKKVR